MPSSGLEVGSPAVRPRLRRDLRDSALAGSARCVPESGAGVPGGAARRSHTGFHLSGSSSNAPADSGSASTARAGSGPGGGAIVAFISATETFDGGVGVAAGGFGGTGFAEPGDRRRGSRHCLRGWRGVAAAGVGGVGLGSAGRGTGGGAAYRGWVDIRYARACRDDRHLQLIAEVGPDAHSEDEVGLAARGGMDRLGHRVAARTGAAPASR